MSKKAYVGVNGSPQNVKQIYVGVGGVPRRVVKGYVGVNGVPQVFWDNPSIPTLGVTVTTDIHNASSGGNVLNVGVATSIHNAGDNALNVTVRTSIRNY